MADISGLDYVLEIKLEQKVTEMKDVQGGSLYFGLEVSESL